METTISTVQSTTSAPPTITRIVPCFLRNRQSRSGLGWAGVLVEEVLVEEVLVEEVLVEEGLVKEGLVVVLSLL